MRKFTLFFSMCILLTFTLSAQKQLGSISYNPNPIVPNQAVVINYDGTGTNFANWTPMCHFHAWLVPVSGQSFSKSYGTPWNQIAGDEQYNALDSKYKMTHNGVANSGQYSVTIDNIVTFFNVDPVDIPKIGQLGFIVRTQWGGDSNQTIDFFLSVGEEAVVPVATDKFNFAFGVPDQSGWVFADFTKSSNDPDKYEVSITLPADFSQISYYVGWNNGGIGNPGWIDGRSSLKLVNTINGIKAGVNNLFIYKTSTVENWGVAVPVSTSVDGAIAKAIVRVDGSVLRVNSDNSILIELYNMAGTQILRTSSQNEWSYKLDKGLYILKLNGESRKISIR